MALPASERLFFGGRWIKTKKCYWDYWGKNSMSHWSWVFFPNCTTDHIWPGRNASKRRKKHEKKNLHATKLDTWNHLFEGLYIPKTLQWNMHEIPKSSWKNCIYKCLLWILVNLPPSVAIILIVFLPCLFGTCQQLHCRIFQCPTVGDAAQDLP